MNINRKWNPAGLAVVLLILGGCNASPAASAKVVPNPTAVVHSFNGGCAGTVLTDAEPPQWAQGGWGHVKGTPWPVRWAIGTPNDAVAYVFGTQLVAGTSLRVDGSQNKVLWVAKDSPSGSAVLVDGHPFGESEPVVSISGGPSITDVPTPGCWTFELLWTSNGPHTSTINLEVLPFGSLPS